MPDKELTPEEKAELEAVDEAMKDDNVAQAAGLVLAAWRLYWLARAQMISVSKGKLTEKNFPIASNALAKAALSGFKVGKFKNQMKNVVMPFLKKLSAQEAVMETKHGKLPIDSSIPAGDETPGNS